MPQFTTSFMPSESHLSVLRNCAQSTHSCLPLSRKRNRPARPSSRISAITACLPSAILSKACPTAKRIDQPPIGLANQLSARGILSAFGRPLPRGHPTSLELPDAHFISLRLTKVLICNQ